MSERHNDTERQQPKTRPLPRANRHNIMSETVKSEETLHATAKNGDIWTGERDGEYWIYQDSDGNLYESKEVPVFLIIMDNAIQSLINGRLTLAAIDTK